MRTTNRRVFLETALQGLSVMMLGCGRDQRELIGTSPARSGHGSGGQTSGESGSGGSQEPSGVAGVGGNPVNESPFPDFGPLQAADELGIRLPEGYSARLLATSGMPVAAPSQYIWHDFPDGAACFSRADGGWIYVSNSEVSGGQGGVGALVFSAEGEPVNAYSIARSASKPCQGGVTPWGTWLSCEEVSAGRVIECDPHGRLEQVERPALGLFTHEGLAYDLRKHHLYMTEDLTDGLLYRFVPSRLTGGFADLKEGQLQAARLVGEDRLEWVEIPDPTMAQGKATRYQLEAPARFNGGEGIWYHEGLIVFTTKGDDKVWSYDTTTGKLTVIYDRQKASNPILSGVDTVIGTSAGELLVAEDQGDMHIIAILPNGELKVLAQVENQASSEITGLAMSPDGARLYFSSQRGGTARRGLTYEITGPFAPAS